MKPLGTLRKPSHVRREQPAVHERARYRSRRSRLPRDADVAQRTRARSSRLNGAKKPAERDVDDALSAGRASRRAASAARAASAGDSVSELNAEITVEIAIVSANCR